MALIPDLPELFPDDRIAVHDPAVNVGRIRNFATLSQQLVLGRRLASVGLEYRCSAGDGLWTMADREPRQLAACELEKLGLAAQSAVVDSAVMRRENAYSICDRSFHEHVAAIRVELERHFPTLHLMEQSGVHHQSNHDRAVYTAMVVARNILARVPPHELRNVNAEGGYHDAGVARQGAAVDGCLLLARPG